MNYNNIPYGQPQQQQQFQQHQPSYTQQQYQNQLNHRLNQRNLSQQQQTRPHQIPTPSTIPTQIPNPYQQQQQQKLSHQLPQQQPQQQQHGVGLQNLQQKNLSNPSSASSNNQFILAAQTITKIQENPKYWSEKLSNEGASITKDTLFYEQLIKRDLINKSLNNKLNLNNSNKETLNKLLKNLKYYNDLKISRMKTINLSMNSKYTKTIWGEGYQGYGNGFTDGLTKLILPKDRKKPSRLKDLNISKQRLIQQSQVQDEFIPIRLEFENEKDRFKLRDTFLWNLNEKCITLEQLVSIIMEDYKIYNPLLSDTILSSIKEQINDYQNFKFQNKFGYDLRILIKLDIIIGNNQLIDQFEWDLSNSLNSPEDFAQELIMDLSLPGEFATAISHSIREQCQLYIKALYLIGYDFKGGFIDEDEIKSNLQKILTHKETLRSKLNLSQFTPQLLEISNLELEKLDKDRERDSRRKRRQGRTGRRGGPILPDLKDVPRTFRTPVFSTVLPGGIDVFDNVESYHIETETINKPINQESYPVGGIPATTTGGGLNKPIDLGTPGKRRKVVYNHIPGESYSLLSSFEDRNSIEGLENVDVEIDNKLNDSDDRLNLEHEEQEQEQGERSEIGIGSSTEQINRADESFNEPQIQTIQQQPSQGDNLSFNFNSLKNNFNFLDNFFNTQQYQRLIGGNGNNGSSSSQSGPNSNDGVFNNLSAKPDTQPIIDSDKPPTYEEAAADSTPPYWEASVLAQGYTDEIFVDGLPVGNIVNFLWNLMVSTSFQFVGFLLTYILHTSHAAKQGSRAGLGFTFISYGYYMLPLNSSPLNDSSKKISKIEPMNPNEYNEIDSNYQVTGPIDEFHSDLTKGEQHHNVSDNMDTNSNGSFIAYLVIIFGVFIIIKALINYHRAKQMEKVILQPPTNLPVVEEV
ncbi:SSWI/SNF chromatin-remodeling complex subunit [Wickerhamomyces ciferrii]|uniref:SSWI/SNF chromatin-remodeling complex subunit n=1 Tax=Wickerhamomyces ciferrii (strain ATCC 14091 / BCRC 22168 / CBS 111 / JCM 3599 / NBRC 0793 / NRRL Y-1031 F-60-10) TaxID=1206466 RepID=K0KFJ4_WICCF|nr:SSWI/SNF chromatin-remodeling complex subunit [Wickerhamomyces ciferrii]CCH41701.1 SSWI/SNF chromatin-remodeling complex subunit [Wickerhamomyces ciferrii]